MIDATEKPQILRSLQNAERDTTNFAITKINVNLGKWKKLELNNVCMATKTLLFYNLTSNISLDKARTKLLMCEKQNYAPYSSHFKDGWKW